MVMKDSYTGMHRSKKTSRKAICANVTITASEIGTNRYVPGTKRTYDTSRLVLNPQIPRT